MEWKELRGQVYKLDADSTNPRPTTRALTALVRYLDDFDLEECGREINKLEDKISRLTKRIESLEKIKK